MANLRRLIDLDKIKPIHFPSTEMDGLDVVRYLNTLPTVDAVEVVNGRWEWFADRCEDLFLGCDDDYGWRCSHCKTPLEDCDDPEVPPTYNYCPDCGAKMDGGSDG